MANIFDSHTHSIHSHDGVNTVLEMANAAKINGMNGFAITDHCDINCLGWNDYHKTFSKLYSDICDARNSFDNTVDISLGIEIAEVQFDYGESENILNSAPFDFVLLSQHVTQKHGDFYDVDYSQMTDKLADTMLVDYYTEILEAVNWGKADVLAHITLPLRYFKERLAVNLDLLPYKDYIDVLLKKIIHKGLGIEINTSGLRTNHEDFMPVEWIVKRYSELGGEIVTLGSDAHRKEHLYAGINKAAEMLEKVGIDYFTVFKERKPSFYKVSELKFGIK